MNAQQLKTWEAEVGYLQEKIQQQQFEIEALKEAHDLSLDGRDFATRQIILDVIANLEKEALAQPEQYPQIAINPEIVGYVAPQRKPLSDEMVVAAARVLNERQADACGVNRDDQWAIYCDDFKADARAMLEATHNIKEEA